MRRPVVIVDPRSSGIELAPAFKARGIPAIGITFTPLKSRLGHATDVRAEDFAELIPVRPDLVDLLRPYEPLAVIAGAEAGVPLANSLAAALTPETANDPETLLDRFHKAHMQRALERAGVPALATLDASSEEQVAAWLEEKGLSESDLVIKPPISAGSEKVLHVSPATWRAALQMVLTSASNITGKRNETAVVQERAYGTEFSVGTVSANGKHSLAHLIQYNKKSFNGSETVYDHVELVQFREEAHGELLAYTHRVLDALGVRWGAAHNEIMLTPKGPRLIESVPRMTGGPVVEFAREATGSSQADKLVEAYVDGRITEKDYRVSKTVVPVFLSSPSAGVIGNVEALAEVTELSTYFRKYVWFKNGDAVPRTVDYLTSIGIVALSGDRTAVFEDYERIRAMESRLVVRSD